VTFNEILSQTVAMLHQHGRVSYRALKRQFGLDDDYLADLTEAILFAHPQVVDEDGRGLVWTGDPAAVAAPAPAPALEQAQAPLAYTPPYTYWCLAEIIPHFIPSRDAPCMST
jgi:hypothetical protein